MVCSTYMPLRIVEAAGPKMHELSGFRNRSRCTIGESVSTVTCCCRVGDLVPINALICTAILLTVICFTCAVQQEAERLVVFDRSGPPLLWMPTVQMSFWVSLMVKS